MPAEEAEAPGRSKKVSLTFWADDKKGYRTMKETVRKISIILTAALLTMSQMVTVLPSYALDTKADSVQDLNIEETEETGGSDGEDSSPDLSLHAHTARSEVRRPRRASPSLFRSSDRTPHFQTVKLENYSIIILNKSQMFYTEGLTAKRKNAGICFACR